MTKVTLDQAEEIVERLTEEEKLRLIRRLEGETLKARWNQLLFEIDRRRKGRPFTMGETQREINAVRSRRR